MLLSKIVKIKANGKTRKYYNERNYEWVGQGNYFECLIEDVQVNSIAKIWYYCDYCGAIHEKEYRSYLDSREIIAKDCCLSSKCQVLKRKEIMIKKYGVQENMQRKESKIKLNKLYKNDFKIIKEKCLQKGLELISDENNYLNEKSELLVICIKHRDKGIQKTCYANIKKNKGCCRYNKGEILSKHFKLDGKVAYELFIKKGYEPKFVEEDYERNNQNLPYICPIHKDKGIQYITYNNLKNNIGCKYCGQLRANDAIRLDKNFVFNEFKKRNLTVIDNNYSNENIPIQFICNEHPNYVQSSTYHNLGHTQQPCKYCREKESLTNLNKRLRSTSREWRLNTEKYYNYKCSVSNLDIYDIHHKYSFNTMIIEALSELNIEIKESYNYTSEEIVLIKNKLKCLHNKYGVGVCIHPKLHELFHIQYGKINNSKEQFEEFKNRYYSGEFDSLLDENIKSYNSIARIKRGNSVTSFFYA